MEFQIYNAKGKMQLDFLIFYFCATTVSDLYGLPQGYSHGAEHTFFFLMQKDVELCDDDYAKIKYASKGN